MQKVQENGTVIIREYEILKSILEDFLISNGYENKKTCIEAWKSADVLNYEDPTHPTRSRKIDPSAPKGSTVEVYVLREYATGEDAKAIISEINAKAKKEADRAKKRKAKSTLITLTSPAKEAIVND